MPERPKPDLDHTREALRRHDQREEEPVEPESGSEAEQADAGSEGAESRSDEGEA